MPTARDDDQGELLDCRRTPLVECCSSNSRGCGCAQKPCHENLYGPDQDVTVEMNAVVGRKITLVVCRERRKDCRRKFKTLSISLTGPTSKSAASGVS